MSCGKIVTSRSENDYLQSIDNNFRNIYIYIYKERERFKT